MTNKSCFKKIFEASSLPSLILIPDSPMYTVSAVSSGFLKITGAKESEVIGKSVFNAFKISPGNSPLFLSLETVIKGRTAHQISELKIDTPTAGKKDFEERYWNIENHPVLDENDEIECIISTAFEVTEVVKNKAGKFIAGEFQLSDESYRNLIKNGSDMISVLDLQGNYKYVSPTASPILGYEGQFLLNKSAFDFIHPDDKDAVFAYFSQFGKVKKLTIQPFRFKHKNGSWVWLETIVTDLTDEPSINGIVTNSRDITERINAQEQLKMSQEKYKSLFEFSPIPKWIIELETLKFLDVNVTAINHYGFSKEEFLNMTVKDIRPPDELSKFFFAIKDITQSRGLIRFGTFTHLKKDGRRIKVDVSGYCHSSLGKNRLMVDCFDVTEREKSFDLIKENEAKLLTALNIARLGYWKKDYNSDRIEWSDEVYNIWEVNKDDYEPNTTSFLQTIHPDDLEAFLKEQEKALTGKKDLDFDHRIILANGSIKWVKENGKIVKDEKGRPVIFQGTVRDITEEKLLKLSLEESNRRYDYVLKATFDAIWDWDMVSDICLWGDGFTTVFGHNIEGRQSPNFWSSNIHPEDHDRIFFEMQEAMAGSAENWENQYRFRKADNTYAYVTDRALIIRDNTGKAIRMVGAIQDITEKKILEQLLDKANRLAKIGSWEIDVLTKTVFWSDITREIREAGPDFMPTLKHGMGNFKPGKDQNTIIKKVQECIDNGTSWEEELQIITEKGNLKWIRTIGKAEMLNGKCVKVYGSFQDIDATKKAEIEIRDLYKEKNTILESIGDAFFALDKNWVVTYWNKEAEKMLMVPKSKIINKYLWDVFSSAENPESYNKYNLSVKENKIIHFEDYFAPLEKWFEISCYPSENGLSVYFKDITERKLSEIELNNLNESLHKKARELAVSNSELEQFAYIASHDLQEPLRMVTSFLNQLQKKYNDVIDDTGRQYIHYAVDGATRMKQIILDLLQYSRVGRLEGESETIDLNEVISQIIMLHQNQIDETRAVINYGQLPVLKNFRSPLRQIFQNLISNSLKYHKEDTDLVINITAGETDTHWLFSVEDNGIGIKEQYFERIFILFQRLHAKNKYKGNGIGLAIVKKIVETLGGEISVTSEVDKGSRFTFTIKK